MTNRFLILFFVEKLIFNMIIIHIFKKFILNKNRKKLSFYLIHERENFHHNSIRVFINLQFFNV